MNSVSALTEKPRGAPRTPATAQDGGRTEQDTWCPEPEAGPGL